MFFAYTGALFPRIDANGNLGIFNQNGTEVATFVGAVFSTKTNFSSLISGSAVDLTTTSTTAVSTGFGTSLTPQVSGNVQVDIQGTFLNNTGSDGIVADAYFTTAAIPTNGSPVVGTRVGSNEVAIFDTVGRFGSMTDIATGLTVGTQYNFYVAFFAVTGGTATIRGTSNVALSGVSFLKILVRET